MSKLTLSFKGKLLNIFTLSEGETLVGSDTSCQIHIDSLAIQPHHATIKTSNGQSVLTDLDTVDGTYVNQARIQEHTLADGDEIRIGKHNLTFAQGSTDEAAPLSRPVEERTIFVKESPDDELETFKTTRRAWLQILNGKNLGKTIGISRNMTNLGKPGVQTAIITRRDDGYFLSHLEGKVSPLVDDTPIGEKRWHLEDGQVITIGNIKMQFFLQ